MHRREPPSSALASATACPVVPLPAKKSSTTASAGMVPRIRRTSPVGFGESKTCPTISFSSATAVSVEPDLLGQPDRAQLLAPPARRVQPVLLEHVHPLARWCRAPAGRPGPRPARRSAARLHRHTAGGPSPKTGRISTASSNGAVRTSPDATAPHTGKCRVRAVDRVELLVGVAQRQVPEPPPVAVHQREVAARSRSRGSTRRARTRAHRVRRPAGTRGWSRTPCPAGAPWG